MTNGKTIIILGGGTGGLVAANELRRRLPLQYRVILIDKVGKHIFAPSLLWLIIGNRRAEKITRDLSILQRRGIEVIKAEVTKFDPEEHSVRTSQGEVRGDHIVISLGADLAPGSVVREFESALNLYTLSGAEAIHAALWSFHGGDIVIGIEATPYKCPAAPHETGMLIEAYLRKRNIRSQSRITIITPESQPMPVAGPAIGAAIRSMLESKGIAFRPTTKIERVDQKAKELILSGGERQHFDILIGIPAHRCPPVLVKAGLAREGGYVSVDRSTMKTPAEGVFAVGDCVGIMLKNGKPLPKAGVFAHAEAEVVAKIISSEILGRGREERFDGVGECFLEAGDRRTGFAKGSFYAEPDPVVKMRYPSLLWHWSKVMFERRWLHRWF